MADANKPTESKQTTGAIVSQQGVDVAIAADYQKVIDTRWRFLDIAFEKEFSMSHADSGATHWWAEKVFDHNLGYKPAFMFRALAFDDGGNFFVTVDSLQVVADEKSIYIRNKYFSGDPTTPIVLRGFLRIFACDISQEYQAPINTAIAGAAVNEPDVGIKLLTHEADIRDTELSKFTVNTRGKALAIQQTGTRSAVSPDFTLTIEHNLGYPPTYFLAPLLTAAQFLSIYGSGDPIGTDVVFQMTVPSGARIRATSFNIVASGAQAALTGDYAFLITKEPTELAI